MDEIEIMSPCGSWETLRAAVDAGANAVYLGVKDLNMRRATMKNFSLEEIGDVVDFCHSKNVKVYLTLNVIVYDNDLDLMKEIVNVAKDSGIDAIIASDFSVLNYCNFVGQEVHGSTQLNISNFEEVKFFSKFCDVLVLARELTLGQIKEIISKIKEEDICGPKGHLLRVEVFVHGALCVSISGKCYMSLHKFGCSANRGECLQPCRRVYRVIEEETGKELNIDNQFIMSPKDLCCVEIVDKLIEAGVSVFKIEGRARGADYVFKTTSCYKKAVEKYFKGSLNEIEKKNLKLELDNIYNRGFWDGGYYLGKTGDEWSATKGSASKKEKRSVGVVKKFYPKKSVAEIEIQQGTIKKGDVVYFIGPFTGFLEVKLDEIYQFGRKIDGEISGSEITIKVPKRIHKSDKIYKLYERQ